MTEKHQLGGRWKVIFRAQCVWRNSTLLHRGSTPRIVNEIIAVVKLTSIAYVI